MSHSSGASGASDSAVGAGVTSRAAWLAVTVAALGYLVDIYDLILFSVVRQPSLRSLGLADADVLSQGLHLLDMQMRGMLIGGVLWGVLGDRRGRLSVLFGSIVLYSLANLANAYVSTVEQYGWLRLIAGIGLAGELGAGITLVSELLDARTRGIATTLIAGVGILGALLAVAVSKLVEWRTAYVIGGVLGLGLLALRVGVVESGMFRRTKEDGVSRGNFLQLFTNRRRLVRYLCVVLSGMPIWFIIGIMMTLAPEIAKGMGMTELPDGGLCIAFGYSGLATGDFLAGWLSHRMQSRKRTLWLFVALTIPAIATYFLLGRLSVSALYATIFTIGITGGYWAIFVTVAAEQFGTNLRATATTTAPNFVRGSLVVMTMAFKALLPSVGVVMATIVVGAVVIAVALVSLFGLEETYGKDLDFNEV